MKKEIHTKDYGYVVAVEYRKVLRVGGSLVVPLTKYVPDSEMVRIIIKEQNVFRTELVIERVNE